MSKRTIDTSLGPFVTDHYRGVAYGHMDADSRIRAVRSFDADQCRQALAMPNLQKTVRAAAERRLRMLEDLAKEQQRVNEQISHPLPPVAEINLSIFECDGCGCPGTELEHLPDEASLYCPICGTRTPTDIARCRCSPAPPANSYRRPQRRLGRKGRPSGQNPKGTRWQCRKPAHYRLCQ